MCSPELNRRVTRRRFIFWLIAGVLSLVGSNDRNNTPKQTPLPDILIPKTVGGGAWMALYSHGVIVNATKGIDLAVVIDNLQRLNSDPAFGINLDPPNEQNITYLFPQPFAGNDQNRQDAIAQAKDEMPLVLSALDTTLHISRGRVRFSIISVADALDNVTRRNPGLTPMSQTYQSALSVELTHAYVGLTRAEIFDASITPPTYPEISATLRGQLYNSLAYPFGILSIDSRYLAALNLLNRSRGTAV